MTDYPASPPRLQTRCARPGARLLIATGVLVCSGFIAGDHAAAAAYPERPIRWIVPAAAGGGADASARVIASALGQVLGQQVVVDNRPGASGTIGMSMLAKASRDGYTIGSGSIVNLVMVRSTRAKLPYDPDLDFEPVLQTHFQPNMLVVTPSLPVASVRELIEHAKTHPEKLLYASAGNGSSLHFTGELFKLLSGTHILHVPYAAVPVAVNDLLGGRVQVMFDNMSSIAPHAKAGRVRALGVTSGKRSPVFPELPAIAETLPGFEIIAWNGIVVGRGTPRAIVQRLNVEANKALASPEVRQRLTALGLEIVGGAPEAFGRLIAGEARKWAEVAKRAGIAPEQK